MEIIYIASIITVGVSTAVYFLFRRINSGPVEFYYKEIGIIFYVLKVSEDKEVAEMIDHRQLLPSTTKGKEYLIPKNSPELEPGKTYELGSMPMGEFILRQVPVLMTA